MRKKWIIKVIATNIIFLFVGAGLASAYYGNQSIYNKPLYHGQILYVGGSNPGNYSKIQDAIDNASAGDTVFVYDDSSPYIENITIKKSIILTGEDRYTTVIDGNDVFTVIDILVNGTIINNFIIQKGTIGINSSFGMIINNVTVQNTEYGIFFRSVPITEMINVNYSILTNNDYGIHFAITHNALIYGNRIEYNRISGLYITTNSSENIEIAYNNISNNKIGIWSRFNSGYNFIHHNNFINNTDNHVWVQNCRKNNWIMNYWDNWIGLKFTLLNSMPKIIWAWYGPIPLFQFDFYPWIEPIPHICP